jgi:hypothetical protein
MLHFNTKQEKFQYVPAVLIFMDQSTRAVAPTETDLFFSATTKLAPTKNNHESTASFTQLK